MRSFTALFMVAASVALARYDLSISNTSPYTLAITQNNQTVVNAIEILTGAFNYTATAVTASEAGDISDGRGHIATEFVTDTVAKIQINATSPYVGADISGDSDALSYGVWEYPWHGKLSNEHVTYEIKGIGEMEGINWSNARAPFFLTSAGYGVYIDTLAMGLFDFSAPTNTRFVFNASSLTVYLILPTAPHDIKSILTQFASLSSHIFMPPDSAYGPIIYSDNWEIDFHGSVSNAQENYYDVINHLHAHQIRATAMFADRPYGTGNGSWGNFDFNLTAYPTPAAFIANLTAQGFAFQVWVANRATPQTLLWNASAPNSWLFALDDESTAPLLGGLAGPALNLSIPAAYSFFSAQLARAFPDALGVRGYKIDRGEENEMPVWEQNRQMSLFTRLCHDTFTNSSSSSDSSSFSFARSAVDRSRSHAAVWNGDSHANFTGLAFSVASGIRAGLLGFAVWGSDTGGYVRDQLVGEGGTPVPVPSEEVWARWMGFAAWSPMYEIMVGTGATPWYAPYNDTRGGLVEVFAETAALHHALLPYVRSYAWQAHNVTGLPIMRALFLEEPRDGAAWRGGGGTGGGGGSGGEWVDSEYFFGAELLVAPIVAAGGAREVYFPGAASAMYVEYFNKSAVFRGGETASVALGLHDVPVYVRAGAIVPRGDVFRANDRWTEDWAPYLDVEVFPAWEVPRSVFKYFNKEKGEVVDVVMTVNAEKRRVAVEYGEVGFGGSVIFYLKGEVKKADLAAGGGEAIVEGVVSLFEV
ncbi:glycoside hydrolase family 31 protein [Diplodia corticola]|uniref:Glycoside hydrolase family 31 protein n=1 Tax=Diplodia corticola TaxID=236234 RepID=A0A1J9R8J7_9PEZI|nr:glycoside hydrolase family 31 protein [Diplodia corticola]OJD36498.1 glycoside hydrolase family 31 protein [Diplodia corticola]